METNSIQSPSTESFSYSWLSFDSLITSTVDPVTSNDHDEASFIEMDPRLPPSKRFIRVSSDHFGFDFPVVSEAPLGLVHADELISNGCLVPLYMKMDDDYYNTCNTSTPSTSSSSANQNTVIASRGRVRCASLRRCRRLSKRFFQKYLKLLLRPLFYRSWRRESCGHNDNMRMRKWDLSNATSPRTSVAFSADDNWRRSCDSESSIYEAVLHCKKTQGK